MIEYNVNGTLKIVKCYIAIIYYNLLTIINFQVFVFCVTVLTMAVVAIAYWVGLPYWWQKNTYITVCLVIYGNWLLLNIVFHYYKGVTTSPGFPPQVNIKYLNSRIFHINLSKN